VAQALTSSTFYQSIKVYIAPLQDSYSEGEALLTQAKWEKVFCSTVDETENSHCLGGALKASSRLSDQPIHCCRVSGGPPSHRGQKRSAGHGGLLMKERWKCSCTCR